MSRRPSGRPGTALAVAVLLPLTTAGAVPASAAPAPAARCARPIGVYNQEEPWPQRRFGLARVWPLSTGRGVTVAVLATGVDARHPQFDRGQVRPGGDVRADAGRSAADRDCDGRGTFAAGLLAARPRPGTTFTGVAPGVTVLPVRYTGARDDGTSDGDAKGLARAVRYAVRERADVVLIPAAEPVDAPELRSAVAEAVAADVVVVSAGTRPERGVSYPTAYPGVLAVAAVGSDGAVLAKADRGAHIDVTAPGDGLVGPVADRGHTGPVQSPGMAAAFVAGTVALVRAYRPRLTAAEVVRRISQTADLPPGRRPDPQLGWGFVNPYAAVTSEDPALGGTPAAGGAPPIRAALPPAATLSSRVRRAGAAAALLGTVAALVVLGVLVRRRRRFGAAAS